MFGHIATSLGIAPREVGEMTMFEVEDLFTYWNKHPPVHLLVAAYMQYEPPQTVEEQQAEGAMGPDEFMRYFERTQGKLANMVPMA